MLIGYRLIGHAIRDVNARHSYRKYDCTTSNLPPLFTAIYYLWGCAFTLKNNNTDSFMKYHYLHIHAIDLYKKDPSSDKIYLDSLSEDIIVQANGFWAFDDLSAKLLDSQKLKISFEKYSDIRLGNRLSQSIADQKRTVPKFLYKLSFDGVAGQDPIGVYKNLNLIVSEVCLRMLRTEGLVKAESDLIEGTIEAYFENNRQYFWMPEKVRERFITDFILG